MEFKSILWLVFISFFAMRIHCQVLQYQLGRLTNGQNIIQSGIVEVLKDSKNYHWIMTQEMVQKYDGIETKHYKLGYIKSRLYDIEESNGGQIFVLQTDRIFHYVNDDIGFKVQLQMSVATGRFLRLSTDLDGKLLILCENGIFKFNEFNQTLIMVHRCHQITNFNTFEKFEHFIYWHNTKKKKTFKLDLQSQALDSVSVPASRHIFVVNKDEVWHSKGGNMTISADFKSKSLKPLNIKQFDKKFLSEGLFVSGVCRLDSRYLMIALAYKGYHLYDSEDDSFKKVTLLYQNKKIIIQNSENKSISCSDDGKIYLHDNEGLYVLLDPKRSFKHFAFNTDIEPEGEESSNTIRGFSEDSYGNIWVATTNGFGVWNVKKRTAKMYFPKPGATNYLNYFSVRSIQVLDNKRILVCQSEKDIWIFNPKLETFKPPNFQNINIKKSFLKSFKNRVDKISETQYLITCSDGVYAFDSKTETIYLHHDKKYPNLGANSIYLDMSKRIWFLSPKGLIATDQNLAELFKVKVEENGNKLSHFSMIEVAKDTFWAVGDNIIEITITKDQKPCVVNIFDDIKNAVFYNLHKDRLGNIWTTTASGIYLLNRDKMSFELYNKSNNIHNQKYNYGHAFESSDGLVYFPGFNGVTYFDPSKFITTKEKLIVHFTSFKINGKSTMLNKSYDLSYDQNDIEISFKAPVINSNQGVKYKYRMKGLDPEWKLSNGVNTIRFSTLRAGTYVFSASASADGHIWYDTGTTITINISPAFYTTWWFYTLIFAGFIALSYYFVKRYINNLKRKSKIKQQLTDLEIKALRSQMNPHFIFNALNSIQFFVFNKDVDTANLYISKFSKLLRLVLNSSESPWIPLGEEIEIIQLYLDIEALRFGDELTYKIEVDDALDDIDDMLIPSMIIQPFIENSIKHGLSSKEGAKTIRIIMTKVNDESFICSISDNGIGRNLSNQIKDQQQKLEFHKSMGMKLIEDRLNIISGQKTLNNIQIMDMFDAKGHASGTRVDILFPIKLNI